MMRSWRIFFSRGIPKRNFDIRRFDSHHQFLYLNDHPCSISTSSRDLVSTRFSWNQQRFQTTGIHRGRTHRERSCLGIDDQLQKLKDNVKKREFAQFVNNMEQFGRSKAVLTQNQNQQLISTLNEWIKDDHSEQEYANALRSLSTMKFSVTNREHQEIIVATAGKFLEKNQHSIRWFALFLTGLRGLH
jgi:hypothetical protein